MKGLSPGEIGFILSSVAIIALIIYGAALHFSHVSSTQQVSPPQCGLSMSLDGPTLFIRGQLPAAYKILINGSQVWPCPKCIEHGYLAVPLGWQFAEVEVLRHDTWRLYVVRLSNGTYAFAWDGKMSRSVCIR